MLYADVLAGEDIRYVKSRAGEGGNTVIVEIEWDHKILVVGEVEISDSKISVGEQLYKAQSAVCCVSLAILVVGRTAVGILIYFYKLFVLQYGAALVAQCAYVSAHHKRGAPKTPHCKVEKIFAVGAAVCVADVTLAVHADDEHVDIVGAAGCGAVPLSELRHCVAPYGLKIIVDVAGAAVQVRAYGAHPCVRFFLTHGAAGENDIASGRAQRHTHGEVRIFDIAASGVVAQVVFEIVNAPFGKLTRVLVFVTEAAGKSLAGKRARRGINAELQSLGMNIVSYILHAVRELLGIDDELPVAALAQHPRVVYDHVLISRVAVSFFNHGIGGLENKLFVDVGTERVP